MLLSKVQLLGRAFSRQRNRRANCGRFQTACNSKSGRDVQAGPSWNESVLKTYNDIPFASAALQLSGSRQVSPGWGQRFMSFGVPTPVASKLPSTSAVVDAALARRTFSAEAATTTGNQVDLPHHRFSVSVGSLLKVVAPHTEMEVDVVVGEDLETIVLEAKWNGDTDSQQLMKLTSTHTDVAIKEVESPVVGSDSETHPFPVPSQLKAWIPERWCSVHVEAGKGAVSVESVVEGHLHIETAGGPIKLGKVRGSASSLSSSGGSVQASSISAALTVRTGGGAVNIQRLLSNKLDMVTAGGNIIFGSVYGEWITVRTNGGSLTANHIRSTKLTSIFTGKGNFHLDGLDGNAKIFTEGGRVELQMHQHAKEVEIDSGGGDVLVYMPSTLIAKVEYEGTGDFQQEGTDETTSHQPLAGGRLVGRSGSQQTAADQGYKGVGNSYSSSGRMDQAAQGPGAATLTGAAADGHELLEELPTCRLIIRGGKGNVVVKRRSWIELIASRSQKKNRPDAHAPSFELW